MFAQGGFPRELAPAFMAVQLSFGALVVRGDLVMPQ